MICLDLHAEGEGEQGCPKSCLRHPLMIGKCHPVCIYDSGKNPWEIRNRLHFRIVSNLDYLHVV